MAVAQFIVDLFESGKVVVTLPSEEPMAEDLLPILSDAERTLRQHLADDAPEFSPEIASWAAHRFYRACQFVVCRDIGADIIAAEVAKQCPSAHSPSTDYSADIVFRFLPDLIQMTRGLAAGDVLLEHLLRLAQEWPLSSVGVTGVASVSIENFKESACLRQLYIDRILRHSDVTRLGVAELDNHVRTALGAFPDLNPTISKHLKTPQRIETNVASFSNE